MLSDRLKSLRLGMSRTQNDVAKYLGVSRQAYTKYENNQAEPDNATLNKLAEFFDVSTDYLLGRSDIKKPESIGDEELKKLTEDPDFMVAYKNYPGSPEEAKEDLIGFLKVITEREKRKKKK